MKGHLSEVVAILGQCAAVGSEWFKATGQPPAGSRAERFMLTGFGIVSGDAWQTLAAVQKGTKAVSAITPKELADIQKLLAEEVGISWS